MREVGSRSRFLAGVTCGFVAEVLLASVFAGVLVTFVSVLTLAMERG